MPHPGTVQSSIEYGSRTIYVYCMDFIGKDRCHYMASVKLSDLPKTTWAEIERRFLCPKCGAKGNVQIRFNHQEAYEDCGRACNIIDGKIVPQ